MLAAARVHRHRALFSRAMRSKCAAPERGRPAREFTGRCRCVYQSLRKFVPSAPGPPAPSPPFGTEERVGERRRSARVTRFARVGHPSPRPSPRSCLTGRGRRTRFSLRRLRHELSQRLIDPGGETPPELAGEDACGTGPPAAWPNGWQRHRGKGMNPRKLIPLPPFLCQAPVSRSCPMTARAVWSLHLEP